jgi:hypothetical protein
LSLLRLKEIGEKNLKRPPGRLDLSTEEDGALFRHLQGKTKPVLNNYLVSTFIRRNSYWKGWVALRKSFVQKKTLSQLSVFYTIL